MAGAGLECINLPELSRSDQKYHGNCGMIGRNFEEWPMFLLLNVLIALKEFF